MSNNIYVEENPLSLIEGEVIAFSHTWLGATTLSTPTAEVFRNKKDVTSLVMLTGSHSISGNVQTLKGITALDNDGRKQYIVIIKCVVDGNTEERKLIINIIKRSDP